MLLAYPVSQFTPIGIEPRNDVLKMSAAIEGLIIQQVEGVQRLFQSDRPPPRSAHDQALGFLPCPDPLRQREPIDVDDGDLVGPRAPR